VQRPNSFCHQQIGRLQRAVLPVILAHIVVAPAYQHRPKELEHIQRLSISRREAQRSYPVQAKGEKGREFEVCVSDGPE
jgi:hypothetical protein